MKKRLALLVIALVVAAIVVACRTADRETWIGSHVDATVDSAR